MFQQIKSLAFFNHSDEICNIYMSCMFQQYVIIQIHSVEDLKFKALKKFA